MYDLKKPFSFHIELTDKCNAMCPSCARVEIKDNELLLSTSVKNQEINLEKFKLIFKKWDKKITEMFFCGNYGDPIAASEFLEIVKYTKEVLKPDIISVHTNGGLKSEAWWTSLAKILKDYNHFVEFGIDGIDQETHSTYRVNTKLQKVLDNAQAFINGGGTALWKMIVFKHNEHQIEMAKSLANDMGFNNFITEISTRVHDEHPIIFKIKDSIKKIEKSTIKKDILEASSIECYYSIKNSIFIAADGNVHTCCWLAQQPNNHPSLNERIIETPSENKTLLECAINRWSMETLPKTFTTNPHPTCIAACEKKLGQDLSKHVILIKERAYE